MRDIEKLAVAQAVYNVVGRAVSTKSPTSLRSQLDAEAERAYRMEGIKSRDVMLNGEKVGSYSCKFTREVPYQNAEFVDVPALENMEQFRAWMTRRDRQERELTERFIRINADAFAAYWLEETGELPGGCEIVHKKVAEAVPGRPAGYNGTVLRIDEEAVAHALAGELPAAVAGLLTDEEGE